MRYEQKHRDQNGVREVDIEVRHLKTGWHGVVICVHDDENQTVSVDFASRSMTARLPARYLETLLEQRRRHAEAYRRRGGSVPLEEGPEHELWSELEERYLLRATEAGVDDMTIAKELCRTRNAVQVRRSILHCEAAAA